MNKWQKIQKTMSPLEKEVRSHGDGRTPKSLMEQAQKDGDGFLPKPPKRKR